MYSTDSKDLSHSPNGKPIIGSAAAAAAAASSPACYSGRFSPTYRTSDQMRRSMTNAQSRDYGGGFLYGQPELFGSLGDGLLASRSEVLGSGGGIGGNGGGGGGGSAGSGGGGNNHGHVQGLNGGNHPDGIKPLARHDTSGFLHPHSGLQVTSSGSLQSQNGRQQMSHGGLDTMEMMEALSVSSSGTPLTSMAEQMSLGAHGAFGVAGAGSLAGHHVTHAGLHSSMYTHAAMGNMMASHSHTGLSGHHPSHPHAGHHPALSGHPALSHGLSGHAHAAAHAHLHGGHMPLAIHDSDSDPRELEAFAERFKQRRIKLGVTQADVGKALANLRLPGVGALSQSTICRFESLTLSHNNMIALKPILHAWLEEAEAQARNKRRDPEAPSVLPMSEKKRKRTSIAAPEKRSLEAYFAVQPRPSGEKIAAIAEKLDLKKNVVRVWFCNQRQKQKRMKFAAQHPC